MTCNEYTDHLALRGALQQLRKENARLRELLTLIQQAASPGIIGTSDWIEMYWEPIVQKAQAISAERMTR